MEACRLCLSGLARYRNVSVPIHMRTVSSGGVIGLFVAGFAWFASLTHAADQPVTVSLADDPQSNEIAPMVRRKIPPNLLRFPRLRPDGAWAYDEHPGRDGPRL